MSRAVSLAGADKVALELGKPASSPASAKSQGRAPLPPLRGGRRSRPDEGARHRASKDARFSTSYGAAALYVRRAKQLQCVNRQLRRFAMLSQNVQCSSKPSRFARPPSSGALRAPPSAARGEGVRAHSIWLAQAPTKAIPAAR
jgi:hypothetical protein